MAKVDIMTTGGTIAAKIDATGAAATTSTDLRLADTLTSSASVPGVDIEFHEVFRKGSANMVPNDWVTLARAIVPSLNRRVDGIVILHGTDTMQYSAAALGFMIQGLSIPVVFTGSMVPGSEPNSDSISNLQAAVKVAACADLGEVCLVFSSDESGVEKSIIRGTRAKKVHSQAINAFASVNSRQLGSVKRGRIELDASRIVRERRVLSTKISLNANVGLIKYAPSLSDEQLSAMLEGLDGAVFEGTGIGHIRPDLQIEIEKFGKPFVVSTQCLSGGEKLGAYDIDRPVLDLPNIVRGGDMLPEVALVKLMWVLSYTSKFDEVRRLMETPIVGEKN